ncbi:hypothetical protein ES702_01945 [subsurface metagenome]
MSKGTDKEIFGDDTPDRIQVNGSKGGRPQINRDLARRLFQAGFSTSQVASKLECHIGTVRRIRKELEESGELTTELREKGLSIVQADFDEECRMAIGISFADWLKTKTGSHVRIFNFCQRVWEKVWGKPSLVLTKDPEDKIGDQLCMKFLTEFGEDIDRIRTRKKLIRNLFRFLGRHDLCDRYLTMTKSRDPIPIKRLPVIEMKEFPINVEAMLKGLEARNPDYRTASELKITSQMRTGKRADERGMMGIRVGSGTPSYLIMDGPDDIRFSVLEKMRENWDIVWIPRSLRLRLWELYQKRRAGDPLFDFKIDEYRKAVKEESLKHIGTEFKPHDFRKISITWLFVMGVPLELAVMINVGWKDLNTPKDHYLHMRGLLKKTERKLYRDNIPDWYKEGLDEYTEDRGR